MNTKQVEVWSLTVDGNHMGPINTSVHGSEAEAWDRLREEQINEDDVALAAEHGLDTLTDEGLAAYLSEHQGLGYQIEPHTVEPTDPDGLTVVVLRWSPKHGPCYDCGLPAAFLLPDAYGGGKPIADHHKRCAICAANAAVGGERVTRIDPEEG